MFTGIISDLGTITALSGEGAVRRLRIAASYDPATIQIGASIACGGPCLTIVAFGAQEKGCWFDVDAAAETLEKTSLGQWRIGTKINLERALKLGDELGGHIVTGHIDGLAKVLRREEVAAGEWGGSTRFTLQPPPSLARFIAAKGSVTLDGVSLTVNEVEGDAFGILLIPHTLQVTTWGERKTDDVVNLEVDLMARYAARLVETRQPG